MTPLSGEEKAGLLLLSLSPRVTASVLAQLGPQTKARLQGHMNRLGASPRRKELADQVLAEADVVLRNLTQRLSSTSEFFGSPRMSMTDESVVSSSREKTHQLRIAPTAANGDASEADTIANDPADAVAKLNAVANDRLLRAMSNESPRTIALILNCLDEEKAGAVFKELTPEIRKEVSVQSGSCATPTPQVVQRTVNAILAREQSLPEVVESKSDDRFKKTAQLLRKLERTDRAEALTALQERDPSAASQVRELLYQFEDILILDGRSLQKVLGELDSKILATAMKTAAEDIMAKVTDNMSKRAKDGLMEEMEYLTNLAPKQIREAQKVLVDIIQRLDQAGEIVMLQ